MLRITVTEAGFRSKQIKLEGRIMDASVQELQRLFAELRQQDQQLNLIVDLSGVSFVDHAGITLLHRLRLQQVMLQHCSPFVAELLKEAAPC
jgi:anti-anti-sigma regulatory factor